MPRRLQDKIHSEKSTTTGVWFDYRSGIIDVCTGNSLTEDINDHLIREYNRKVENLDLTGYSFVTYDAGYRFLGQTTGLMTPFNIYISFVE